MNENWLHGVVFESQWHCSLAASFLSLHCVWHFYDDLHKLLENQPTITSFIYIQHDKKKKSFNISRNESKAIKSPATTHTLFPSHLHLKYRRKALAQ
jgi:hypothetical protein